MTKLKDIKEMPPLPEGEGSCTVVTGHEQIGTMLAEITEEEPGYSSRQTHEYARTYAAKLETRTSALEEALRFYAEGQHFYMHDADAWDTVSGEPMNFYEDESNTATVEDGTIAKLVLAGMRAEPAGEVQPVAWRCNRIGNNGELIKLSRPNSSGERYLFWENYEVPAANHLRGLDGYSTNPSMTNWQPLYTVPNAQVNTNNAEVIAGLSDLVGLTIHQRNVVTDAIAALSAPAVAQPYAYAREVNGQFSGYSKESIAKGELIQGWVEFPVFTAVPAIAPIVLPKWIDSLKGADPTMDSVIQFIERNVTLGKS